ncbi:UNVERIFIED_CONTAM: hypothetical protein K2H54_000128 [Gekko kuhli]
MVQLAGARGDYMADDIILPLADDNEFAEIMINPITAPTYERHFFGGDATSFEAIDAADRFTWMCGQHGALLGRNGPSDPAHSACIRSLGSTVKVCAANSASGVEVAKTAGTTIDRAVLLGGQALANAFGSGEEGGAFNMHEEKTDHGNSTEISVGWISGLQKIRFEQKNGNVQDHGCMALDTAIMAKLAAVPAGDVVVFGDPVEPNIKVVGVTLISSALGASTTLTVKVGETSIINAQGTAAAVNSYIPVDDLMTQEGQEISLTVGGGAATGTVKLKLHYEMVGNL